MSVSVLIPEDLSVHTTSSEHHTETRTVSLHVQVFFSSDLMMILLRGVEAEVLLLVPCSSEIILRMQHPVVVQGMNEFPLQTLCLQWSRFNRETQPKPHCVWYQLLWAACCHLTDWFCVKEAAPQFPVLLLWDKERFCLCEAESLDLFTPVRYVLCVSVRAQPCPAATAASPPPVTESSVFLSVPLSRACQLHY